MRIGQIKNLISILLVFLIIASTTSHVLADDASVNALGKITVKEVEESGFLQTLKNIGGKVIGRVIATSGIILEIAWPDVVSNSIFLEMCVDMEGSKQCTDSDSDKQQFMKVNTSAPASYTITWRVLEGSNETKCYAFDAPITINTSSTAWGVSFFEGLPYVGSMTYIPNINWNRSIGRSGEAPFVGIAEGTYYYNMVCYNPGTGNWLTNAIDKLMLFGKVTQQSFFIKQQTINVTVGVAEEPVSVDITADPTSVKQGQPTTVQWKSKNATSCKGKSSGINYPIFGSFIDTPSATREYGMVCTGSTGSATDSVTVTVINTPPTGYHDGTDNAACETWGWARDADTPNTPVEVHVYVDAPAGSGNSPVYAATADQPRTEPSWPFPDKNHGFKFTLPAGLKDGKQHQLYIYPIDTTTGKGSPSNILNNSPRPIQCGYVTPPSPVVNPGVPFVDIRAQ